jgi:two-component system, cell cycle sensor histidine kinase and response regulator CckA
VQGCAPLLKTTLGESIRLTIETTPGVRPVRAQRIHVEQILMNLAINARDAMPQGGQLSLRIADPSTRPAPEGRTPVQFVELTVADSGLGMSQEIIDRIFEPFFTTKDQNQGTGLGLAIVHGILQELGGFVHVTSQVGQGSSFHVCLPAAVDLHSESEQLKHALPLAPQRTVLLVEVDAGVSEVTQAILKQQGFRVLAARSGEEASAWLRDPAQGIDLILADVVMTGLGGRQFADKALNARPGVPILFMSGHTHEVIIQHGIEPGRDNFIAKPYHPHLLAARIRQILTAGTQID